MLYTCRQSHTCILRPECRLLCIIHDSPSPATDQGCGGRCQHPLVPLCSQACSESLLRCTDKHMKQLKCMLLPCFRRLVRSADRDQWRQSNALSRRLTGSKSALCLIHKVSCSSIFVFKDCALVNISFPLGNKGFPVPPSYGHAQVCRCCCLAHTTLSRCDDNDSVF